MLRRVLTGLSLALTVVLFGALPADAHRNGCHRWHSCPSDTGSYTCGDWGYSNYCGTRETYEGDSLEYRPYNYETYDSDTFWDDWEAEQQRMEEERALAEAEAAAREAEERAAAVEAAAEQAAAEAAAREAAEREAAEREAAEREAEEELTLASAGDDSQNLEIGVVVFLLALGIGLVIRWASDT
jgi:hypothetical protein